MIISLNINRKKTSLKEFPLRRGSRLNIESLSLYKRLLIKPINGLFKQKNALPKHAEIWLNHALHWRRRIMQKPILIFLMYRCCLQALLENRMTKTINRAPLICFNRSHFWEKSINKTGNSSRKWPTSTHSNCPTSRINIFLCHLICRHKPWTIWKTFSLFQSPLPMMQ